MPVNSILNRKWVQFLPLGLLLVVSAGLGFFRIGVGEQHVDVYQVMGVFHLSWGQLVTDFFTQPTGLYGGFQAPLYFLLAKAYGSLFGSEVIHLAIFSVIALVLLVVLSWFAYPLLTRDVNQRLRFLFVLLVATSPVHIWWAQTAKYDMWFTLVSAVSLVAGLWFIQKRDTPRLILFSLSTAATIYTHYFGFVLLAAQFCTLGLLALYQRDKAFASRLVVAGLLTVVLIAPLIPVAFQATRLRQAERYHFTEGVTGVSTIGRGILIEWVFGYGLVPNHGAGVRLWQAFQMASTHGVVQAIPILADITGLLAAAFVLLLAGLNTVYRFFKRKLIRENAVYILGVPLLAFVLSQAGHMSFRFSYLGIGTWCILGFVAMGLPFAKRPVVPVLFAIGMMLVYAVSLTTYYQNMNYRYPGMELVAKYLHAHTSDFQTALIDRWTIDNRGRRQEYQLPHQLGIRRIGTPSDIPWTEIKNQKTVAFISGRREQVQSNLDALKSATPGISWNWLESWMSLQLPERSINVVQVSYSGER